MKDLITKTPSQDALSANLITKEEHESLNTFFTKISKATLDGEEWVETSPQIIDYYNKRGLGKAEYFIYQGIKVCEYGKSERLDKEMGRQLGEILYGKDEGKVNQIESTRPVAGAP